MKVINSKTCRKVSKYIGRWYDRQCAPQPIHLHLNSRGECWIEHDCNIGSGCSPDVFFNRELRVKLPFVVVLSPKEERQILKETKKICRKLSSSYLVRWDGNNHNGQWDEKMVEELEECLSNIVSEYEWVEE